MFIRAVHVFRPLCVRFISHYVVLGVPRSAKKSVIKKAYLEKAKECHPDLNPGNEKADIEFQRIQEAHDVLMSSKQRAKYNHYLSQETYYGSGSTSYSEDGRPRRAHVRTHGTDSSSPNEKFHDRHRVNRDNYQYPGSRNKFYSNPFSSQFDNAMSDSVGAVVLIGIGIFAVSVYCIVYLITSIKREVAEGRHGKSKAFHETKQSIQSIFSSGEQSSLGPFTDTNPMAMVSDEEKGNLMKMGTLEGKGKDKCDVAMKVSLGKVTDEDEVEDTAPTIADTSLLKIELSKKKSEYLSAKKEYNEKLEEFTKEQNKKKSRKARQEVI